MRGARCNVRDTICDIQCARCKMRGTMWKMRDARCEMQCARCEMRGTMCEVRGARYNVRGARCNVRDARYEMQCARYKMRDARYNVRDTRCDRYCEVVMRQAIFIEAAVRFHSRGDKKLSDARSSALPTIFYPSREISRCGAFYGLWLNVSLLIEAQIRARCLLSLVCEALRGSLRRDQALFLPLTVPRRSRVVGDVMASQQALLFGSEVGSGEGV